MKTFKKLLIPTSFQKIFFAVLGGMLLFSYPLFAQTQAQPSGNLDCKMTFNFKSWSFFFHSGKGDGVISCNNGEKADVLLSTKGGGVFDFGKSDIINGHGKFSPVSNIQKLFGSYAATGAGIGIGKTVGGLSLSKSQGNVTLDLSGAGTGAEVGFHFGDFKIEPKIEAK